jgi:hypothetical protein
MDNVEKDREHIGSRSTISGRGEDKNSEKREYAMRTMVKEVARVTDSNIS